jgi:hypothetical protein
MLLTTKMVGAAGGALGGAAPLDFKINLMLYNLFLDFIDYPLEMLFITFCMLSILSARFVSYERLWRMQLFCEFLKFIKVDAPLKNNHIAIVINLIWHTLYMVVSTTLSIIVSIKEVLCPRG